MNSGKHVRLTLEKIGDQFRGSILIYEEFTDLREESVDTFIALSRNEALAVAQRTTTRLGRIRRPHRRAKGGPLMARFIDPLYHNNFIDSNILDEVVDGHEAAVQEIMRIADAGKITVLLPYSVCNEIKKPNTPAHVRLAVNRFIFSIEVNLTANQRQNYRDLVESVRGDAEERNIAPDLFHVWEAANNGGGYFISRDKRLLARSGAIAELLQIEVVTPAEFLDRIAMAHRHGTVPSTA